MEIFEISSPRTDRIPRWVFVIEIKNRAISFRPMKSPKQDLRTLYCLKYWSETVFHLGPGTGGIALEHQIKTCQNFPLPIRMKEMSDVYEGDFQLGCKNQPKISLFSKTSSEMVLHPSFSSCVQFHEVILWWRWFAEHSSPAYQTPSVDSSLAIH